MPYLPARVFARKLQPICASLAFLVLLGGCASTGPPRPPSLNLPGTISGFSAERRGESVDLRFTVPQETTDHLPLRADSLRAVLCRAVEYGRCVSLPDAKILSRLTAGQPTQAVLHDALPMVLVNGVPRLLAYRVEFFNPEGHTAGFSDPAFTLAGTAPAPVAGLAAKGSRLGVVLSWQAATEGNGRVTLLREDLAPQVAAASARRPRRSEGTLPVGTRPHGAEAISVWLAAPQPDAVHKLLDTTVVANDPYRYIAERRRSVSLGGHTLEMRSDPSMAVIYVWHDVYPPPAPRDLMAAVFSVQAGNPAAGDAVDLIWQPVDSPNLRGYLVSRQALDQDGNVVGKVMRLTSTPLALPAFHNKLPLTGGRFRYWVTAIDNKGNESAPATTTADTIRH